MIDPAHVQELEWYFTQYESDIAIRATNWDGGGGVGSIDSDFEKKSAAIQRARWIEAALGELSRRHQADIKNTYTPRRWGNEVSGVPDHLKGILWAARNTENAGQIAWGQERWRSAHQAYCDTSDRVHRDAQESRERFMAMRLVGSTSPSAIDAEPEEDSAFARRDSHPLLRGYWVDRSGVVRFGAKSPPNNVARQDAPRGGYAWPVNEEYEGIGEMIWGLRLLHGLVQPKYQTLAEWAEAENAAPYLVYLRALCQG